MLKLENKVKVVALLTYHVIPSKAMAAEVIKLDGKTVKSAEGLPIKVKVVGKTVTVDNAKPTNTHIACPNGVIHMIDTVIMPPKK